MKQVTLKQVKNGETFRLSPTSTAPVWVRGKYDNNEEAYCCYRIENKKNNRFVDGDSYVWIDFEF